MSGDKLAAATAYVIGKAYLQMSALENAKGRARQVYHIPRHISVMGEGANTLALALGIEDPTSLATIQCAVACHDWYQDFDPDGMMSFDKRGILQRKRMRGPNEKRSALKFKELMNEANDIHGHVFSPEQIALGVLGIEWTYPEWVNEAGTFYHPLPRTYHKENGSSPEIAFAIYAADLLDVNTNPARFIEFARREYVEVAWGLHDALATAKRRSDIPNDRLTQLDGHLLAFFGGEDGTGGQLKFRKGREVFTQEDISLLPQTKHDPVRSVLLSKTKECHQAVVNENRLLRSLPSFYERAWVVGFGTVPTE